MGNALAESPIDEYIIDKTKISCDIRPKGKVCENPSLALWVVKLVLCVFLDAFDWLLRHLLFLSPGSGIDTVYDAFCTAIAYFMFGPMGMAMGWEIIPGISPGPGPLGRTGSEIDSWIPTMTLLAIGYYMVNKKEIMGR